MKKLLLLSNSTMHGQSFFSWPAPYLKTFLGEGVKKVLFFPYAGVSFSFDEYHQLVRERFSEMGLTTISAHEIEDMQGALEACDAIAVGGGNTWQLVDRLQKGWMELIRKQVLLGKPYFGWSAGANVACPTIKTTNDMPILQPGSFDALGLVDFQINPHYTEEVVPNHGGETRPDRIKEFLVVNPEVQVMGLPEGSLLEIEGEEVVFKGQGTLKVFSSTGVNAYTSGDLVCS
jgi:dipeptidase E